MVSDANEIGSSPQRWRGNILYGKIQTGGNIDWVTANKPEEMGYFHGVSMGDLNKDGLLDVGGTPGIFTGNGINLFFQQPNGTFKLTNTLTELITLHFLLNLRMYLEINEVKSLLQIMEATASQELMTTNLEFLDLMSKQENLN